MKKIILKIEGMSCSACSIGLEKYLKKQVGIIDASVNLVMAEALITYEDNLTEVDLNKMVKDAGFKSLGNIEKIKIKEKTENKISFSLFGRRFPYIKYLVTCSGIVLSYVLFNEHI